jgi:hypothetical protein
MVTQNCYETIQQADCNFNIHNQTPFCFSIYIFSAECSLECVERTEATRTMSSTLGNRIDFSADSDDSDCPSPTINEIQNSTNNYLNRKLNQYAKLRQVKLTPKPNHENVKPVRTFTLLQTMKQIATKTCPAHYVNADFLDSALDLFIILHQRHDYRRRFVSLQFQMDLKFCINVTRKQGSYGGH